MFSRRSELRLVRQAGLRRSSALGILISTRINSYFMLVILFIDIQLGRLTPMSEYPCSGASAERPRPRGQSRCQGPAREDAGAPLRRRWLRLLLKHYQRRAKVTAPLRGKRKSSNLCKADHLKLNITMSPEIQVTQGYKFCRGDEPTSKAALRNAEKIYTCL